jgi:hypothetical protein
MLFSGASDLEIKLKCKQTIITNIAAKNTNLFSQKSKHFKV